MVRPRTSLMALPGSRLEFMWTWMTAAVRRWTLTLLSEIEIVFRPARLLQIGFKIGYPLPQVPVLGLELADAAGGVGPGELILAGCQRGLEASPFTVGRMSVGLGTTDL